MVPRLIHQIWLGSKPTPFPEYRASWTKHHPAWLYPAWQYQLWTEATLPLSPRQHLIDACGTCAAKANIIRLELLAKFGGLYADVDVECLKPFDDLLDKVICGVPRLHSRGVANFVFASIPEHPWILHQLSLVEHYVSKRPPWSSDLMRRSIAGFADVTQFPPELFPHRGGAAGAAYAVHDAAGSWYK